jgi:hypothetical protein
LNFWISCRKLAGESGKLLEMERDIVCKLTAELEQQITSERQIVYILVELRKLLEKNNTLNQYRALKLCCDWAAHPRLSYASAQVITRLFDQYEAKYRREPLGVSQADMPELVEFCEHTRFRAQFIEACEASGIPSRAPKNDEWWGAFLTQYSEVVKDCPIEARADNTKYVTRVTASAMPPELIGITNRRFGICWMWERKDIEAPGTVISVF